MWTSSAPPLKQALDSGGEGLCDVRISDGEGNYISFHITGRIMEHSREKSVIYVTYIPID